MKRRQALAILASGMTAIAGGKALDNAVLGYGALTGTNLRDQDLSALVRTGLEATPFEIAFGRATITFTGHALTVTDSKRTETLDVPGTTLAQAAEVDARFDLHDGPMEQLIRDIPAINAADIEIEVSDFETFFDRLEAVKLRPFAVEPLRNRHWMSVDPTTVENFVGASTTNPRAVVRGLAEAFREHTYYDAPRYVAGSIDDNLLGGAGHLRGPFRSATSFQAIEQGEYSGLFCWEFTHRSMEALQAIPAHLQEPPLFVWEVYDRRHGHMYTAIGSAYREGTKLTLALTFLDYSRSTWYDDFGLRRLFGEGINAYDSRHRATRIGRDG